MGHDLKRPSEHVPEQYEDTPEFRQSMNLKGEGKEALLKKLRQRLGVRKNTNEPAPGTNAKVLWQGANKNPSMGGNAPQAAASQVASPAQKVEVKPAAPTQKVEAKAGYKY